jgi:hypothetical protein
MAPACTVDLFHKSYGPVLAGESKVKLDDLTIYNLSNRLEEDDNVAQVYRKSLLYLVSNAFERKEGKEDKEGKPLLGMQKFVEKVKVAKNPPKFVYSNGIPGQRTRSLSHGGFDNDPDTMNDILKRVLGKGKDIRVRFTEENLKY